MPMLSSPTTSKVLFVLLSLVYCESVSAAAWLQPKDETYLKIWNRTIAGNESFAIGDDDPFEVDRYEDHQLNIYAEGGAAEDTTLTLRSVPFGFAVSGTTKTYYSGMIMIGVRKSLSLSDSWKMAYETRVGIESGYGAKNLSESTYTDTNGKVHKVVYKPANKNKQVEGEFQAGRSIEGGWIVLTTGVAHKTSEDLDNVILANFQIGFKSSPNFRHSYDISVNNTQGEINEINVSGAGQTNYVGFNIGLAALVTETGSATFDLGGALFAEANSFSPSLSVGYETTIK